MERLETLAKSMLKHPFRFEEADERLHKYEQKKADELGISLEQYKQRVFRMKVRPMVQECVFGENDDIILFTDCRASYSYKATVDEQRERARNGHAHTHDYFEMLYVLKGYCYHYINGEEEIFEEGSVCMMNYQIAHERVIPDDETILLTICVRKKVFDTYLLNMLRDIPMFWQFYVSSLKSPNQPGAYLHLQDSPQHALEDILYQMLRAYLLNDATSQIVMKCHLIPLLAEMARIHCVSGFNTQLNLIHTSRQNTIKTILETICAKCGTVTLQELADAYHFSPNYLSKLIKEETGKTFRELASYYWGEKAKTLLQCTSLEIDKISELMGASSRGNFERRFKALAYVSPAKYRNQTQSALRKNSMFS